MKHFASLLGARGIRVNAVAPGVVETDLSSFTKTDAGRDFALGMQAFKRLARPRLAGVIAFLASDEARWITGDTIHVDGPAQSSETCRTRSAQSGDIKVRLPGRPPTIFFGIGVAGELTSGRGGSHSNPQRGHWGGLPMKRLVLIIAAVFDRVTVALPAK